VAPLVPYGLQAKLGTEVRDQLTAGHALCTGEEGLRAINDLAHRLGRAAGHERPVKVEIVKGGPVNALTLPGDRMIFYSDLIDGAKDGSQVAGVLAHEMGHVVHAHAIKGMARQYGLSVLLGLLTGGYSEVSTLASGGSLLLAMRNGRAFERDADATGVALLEKLDLRADGISTFFSDMMKGQPTDMAAVAGIWSSHPPTAERIAATKRPASGKPAFSDAEWKALRAVCTTSTGSDIGRTRQRPDSLQKPKRD
jgi:predicted Zn-dependent protease